MSMKFSDAANAVRKREFASTTTNTTEKKSKMSFSEAATSAKSRGYVSQPTSPETQARSASSSYRKSTSGSSNTKTDKLGIETAYKARSSGKSRLYPEVVGSSKKTDSTKSNATSTASKPDTLGFETAYKARSSGKSRLYPEAVYGALIDKYKAQQAEADKADKRNKYISDNYSGKSTDEILAGADKISNNDADLPEMGTVRVNGKNGLRSVAPYEADHDIGFEDKYQQAQAVRNYAYQNASIDELNGLLSESKKKSEPESDEDAIRIDSASWTYDWNGDIKNALGEYVKKGDEYVNGYGVDGAGAITYKGLNISGDGLSANADTEAINYYLKQKKQEKTAKEWQAEDNTYKDRMASLWGNYNDNNRYIGVGSDYQPLYDGADIRKSETVTKTDPITGKTYIDYFAGSDAGKTYLANNMSDSLREAVNGNVTAGGDKTKNTVAIVYDYLMNGKSDRKAFAIDGTGSSNTVIDSSYFDFMTNNERATYLTLYNEDGKDSANEYLKHLLPELEYRFTQRKTYYAGETANDIPVLASIGSVPVNAYSGINYAKALVGKIFGKDSSAYDMNALATNLVNTVRDTVSEDMGTVGRFVYQTGMSMADCVFDMALAYVAPLAAGSGAALEGASGFEMIKNAVKQSGTTMNIIMSSSAAEAQFINSLQNGKSTTNALIDGGIAGFAEYITEKKSIETFLNAIDTPKWYLKLLFSALSEGSEEINADIINTLGDALVNGGQSELSLRVGELMANGMSRNDALSTAWGEWIKQTGLDGLGGAVSGIGFMFGSMGMNYVQNKVNSNTGLVILPELPENTYATGYGTALGTAENNAVINSAYDAGKQGLTFDEYIKSVDTESTNVSDEMLWGSWFDGYNEFTKTDKTVNTVPETVNEVENGTVTEDNGASSVPSINEVARTAAYDAGLEGKSFEEYQSGLAEDVKNDFATVPEQEQLNAWVEGQKENYRLAQEQTKVNTPDTVNTVNETVNAQKTSGDSVIRVSVKDGKAVDHTGSISEEGMRFYDAFSEAFGVDTEFVNKLDDGAWGEFSSVLNRISVSTESKNSFSTYLHETGHLIKMAAPKEFAKITKGFTDYVVGAYGNEAMLNLVEQKKKSYGTDSYFTALDEVICDQLEAVRKSDNFAENMAKALHKNGYSESKIKRFFRTISEFFRKMADTIRNLAKGKTVTSAGIYAEQSAEYCDKLAERYIEAMNKVGEYMRQAKRSGEGVKVDGETKKMFAGENADTATELDRKYLEAVKSGDMSTAQAMVEQAAREWGCLVTPTRDNALRLYHQTSADFYVFDTKHEGSGTSDDETPFGIFMKTSPDNIGVKGEKQMSLFAKMDNPLRVENRETLVRKLNSMSAEYSEIRGQISKLNNEYRIKTDKASENVTSLLLNWSKDNPNAKRGDAYQDETVKKAMDEEDRLVDEWVEKDNELCVKAKEIINKTLKDNGYDGVILYVDSGSFGRKTDAYIALEPEQVKSADTVTYDENGNVIPLSERFNDKSNDIRYMKGESDTELERTKAELANLRREADFESWNNSEYRKEMDRLKKQYDYDVEALKYEMKRKEDETGILSSEREKQYNKELSRLKNEYENKIRELEYTLELEKGSNEYINSEREKYYTKEMSRLEKESERKINNLVSEVKMLKSGIRQSGGTVSVESVKDIVRRVNEKYGIKLSLTEDAQELTRLYARMADFSGNSNELVDMFKKYADERIIPKTYVLDDSVKREYGDVLNPWRKTGIKLNDNQISELEHLYGEPFGKARSRFFGRAMFNRNSGLDLDSNFAEWYNLHPDMFPGLDSLDNLSDADEINYVIKALDNAKPFYRSYLVESYAGHTGALSNDIAVELYDEFWNTEEIKTIRRAQSETAAELEHKHNAEMREYKKATDKIIKLKTEQLKHSTKEYEKLRYSVEREKLRAQIKKEYKYFSDLVLHPTSKLNAPLKLYNALLEVCRIINFTNNYDTQVGERLINLRVQFNAMATSEFSDYNSMWDENKDVAEIIQKLADKFVPGKALFQMSNEDLSEVSELMSSMHGILADATQQIDSEEKRENHEIAVAEAKIIDKADLRKRKFYAEKTNTRHAVRYLTGYDENSYFAKSVDSLEKGVIKARTLMNNSKKDINALVAEDKGRTFRHWRHDLIDTPLKDNLGNSIKMTHSTLCLIMLTYNREAKSGFNIRHLSSSGGTILDIDYLEKGERDEAYRNGVRIASLEQDERGNYNTDEVISSLRGLLTDYDKRFIVAARRVLGGQSELSKAVDKTMFLMKHKHMTFSKDYIPENVDKKYVRKGEESLYTGGVRTENKGFTHEVRAKSDKPLIISDLYDVIMKHIEDEAIFAETAIPFRNLNKIMNANDVFTDGTMSVNMPGFLDEKWGGFGKGASANIIEQMWKDVQSNRVVERGNDETSKWLKKVISNYKGAVLTANIPVSEKQISSYWVAGVYIDFSNLLRGYSYGDSVIGIPRWFMDYDKLNEEIGEHTSVYADRMEGLSTQEIAEMTNKISRLERLMDKSDFTAAIYDFIKKHGWSKWIQHKDLRTVGRLWYACKFQVESDIRNGDFTVEKDGKTVKAEIGSDEYWQRVTDLFERVVLDTQPVYDMLHRPEMLKGGSEITGLLHMFKTQVYQQMGVVADATGEMQAKNREYQNAKNSGNKETIKDAKEKAKKAKRMFGKSLKAVLVANISITLIDILTRALLHKGKNWEDEYGDFSASMLIHDFGKTFLGYTFSTRWAHLPVNVVNFADTIVETIIGNKTYSDEISSPPEDLLNGVTEAVLKITKLSTDFASGKYDNKTDEEKYEIAFGFSSPLFSLVKTVGNGFGVPTGNIVDKWIKPINAWKESGFSFDTNDRTASQYYDGIYDALVSGDREKADEWYSRAREKYSPAAIDTGIKSRLKTNETLDELASAYLDGDFKRYEELKDGLLDMGFSENQIYGARNSNIKSREDTTEDPDKESSDVKEFSGQTIAEIIISGDKDNIDYVADWFAENGSKSSLSKIIAPMWREADEKTREAIEDVLVDKFGYNENVFNDWVFSYHYSDIYDAFDAGDSDTASKAYEDFTENGKSDELIQQTIKKHYKESYKKMTGSERVKLQDFLRKYCGFPSNYNFNSWLND